MTPEPQKDPRANAETSAEARRARLDALISWGKTFPPQTPVYIVVEDDTPSPDDTPAVDAMFEEDEE